MLLIVTSAIVIGATTSYRSYSDFKKDSEQLEIEYIVSQNTILRREVSHVENLIKF